MADLAKKTLDELKEALCDDKSRPSHYLDVGFEAIRRCLAAESELAQHQEDARLAAGELLVPLPTPGTDAARMMRANVLMRRQRDAAREELAATRSLVESAQADRQRAVDDLFAEAKRSQELQAELTATRAKLAEVTALREGDLTALSKSCNELSAALADRSELVEKLRKARRQRNESNAEAAVLRHKLAEVERELATARHVADGSADNTKRLWLDLGRARRHMGLLCDRLRFEVSDHKTPCSCSSCVFVESAEQALASAGADADRTEAPKSLREQAREKLAAMSDSQVSNLWVRLQHLEPEPPRPEAGESGPVCSACGDTHWVWISTEYNERKVMCTSCPVPCERCRSKPQGPYCAATPCPCECHKPTEEPKPEPQPSGEDANLSARPWRHDGTGMIWDADGYVLAARLGLADAAFIVSRCNAQVEGLAEAIRHQINRLRATFRTEEELDAAPYYRGVIQGKLEVLALLRSKRQPEVERDDGSDEG